MKIKHITLISLAALFVLSCGAPDAKKQISRLETKKAELQKQIKEIETQIHTLKADEGEAETRLVPVNVSEVKHHKFQNYFTVQGDVTSDKNIQVPAEYSGVIRSVKYEEGDYVQAGTLLAEIDNELLLKQKSELETSLELAVTSYERQKRLWDQQIGSEMQYLQAKNQKESLEKRMETLMNQLDKTRITAPISGHIDEVIIKEGEIIQMGMPSFRIVQLTNLKVEAEVSEQYVSEVHKGDSVLITFSGNEDSFMAKINAISQVIDPDSRTFTIEVKIPDGMKDIKPNMMSEVKIFNYVKENALCIPMDIIQKNENGNFVFVINEQEGDFIAERRNITIGRYNTHLAEVESGIVAGEIVITDGYQNISNGQHVEILN